LPTVYIGLGANLGDRESTLRAALAAIDGTPGLRVVAVSSFRETAPVGGPPGQPRYLNAAARLECGLEPRALLERLQAVERDLGRDRAREVRFGPRTVDLDILVFEGREVREPDLVLPHPRMRERAFVMEPLAELGYHAAPMLRIESIAAMRAAARDAARAGLTVGFVPTMGALHEGHLALARRARAECGRVFASVFVNPLQFGPSEDFARYPRDLEGDARLLESVPIDGLFAPRADEIVPAGMATRVAQDERLTGVLEGRTRPGHFGGVLTIVLKLFAIVRPDRAYFGQKDLQQTVVLRRMVADLDLGVEMVICPTVREADGLAMSSRNRYLSPEERKDALALSRGLRAAEAAFRAGERDGPRLAALVRGAVAAVPAVRLDYAEVVGGGSLAPVATAAPGDAAVVAAWVGKTRLIDNVIF
jgi:pantoate--beta-alanine ligase